jgi:hypothetical protein
MVGIRVSAGAGSVGAGPYPGGSWADSAPENNRVDVTSAIAAFSELDMRTPLGMVNGNDGDEAMFRTDWIAPEQIPVLAVAELAP